MPRKTLDTNSVRDRLGEILDEAYYQGNEFVIQRRGKSLAVIIPYARYEQLERARAEAFRVFHETWEANKNVDPEEVARIVEREVETMRAERRRRKRSR